MTTTSPTMLVTVRLGADELACAACGRASVPPEPDSHRLVLRPEGLADPEPEPMRTITDPPRRRSRRPEKVQMTVEFTRCPDCAGTAQVATALLARFPAWASSVGSVGAARVLPALDGLAAAGIPMGVARAEHLPRPALVSLVERVAAAGRLATWADRYAETMPPGGVAATVGAWAHLDGVQRARLRDAVGLWMADRAALRRGPRLVHCPSEWDGGTTVGAGACLICGIGSTTVPAYVEDSDAWEPIAVTPATVGVRGGTRIRGHLCRTCDAALHAVGAVGPTFIERALMDHLGLRPTTRETPELNGLTSWVATRTKPWVEPFGWLDHEAVRAVLADVTEEVAR